MSIAQVDGWISLAISEIAVFGSGDLISVARLSARSSTHPVPVYGGNGIAGYTSLAMVDQPTVILGRVGQKCGVVYRNDGQAWVTDNALYARRFKRLLDIKFFSFALEAAQLNDIKTRNDLPLITQTMLNSVKIAWPVSLNEQRQIVEALTDVDEQIATLERLIAKQQAVKQGMMQQLLTGRTRLPGFDVGDWKSRPLRDEVILISGVHVMAKDCNEQGFGTPYLTGPADFPGDEIKQEKFTTRPIAMCRKGDILITVKGSGAGTMVRSDADYCISRQLVAVRSSEWNLGFLLYSLMSNASSFKTASAGLIPGLSRSDILDQEIPIPPTFSEQVAIAEVLSDADAEIALLRRRLAKTRSIKHAMMQQLLTGRTRLPPKEAVP